jgi:hypothetical protein
VRLDNDDPAQKNGAAKVIQAIKNMPEVFRRLGLDNIEVIVKKGNGSSRDWADGLVRDMRAKDENMSNLIFFTSADTALHLNNGTLKGVPEKNRPFVSGVDPGSIRNTKRDMTEEYVVNIVEMLLITLELASGGKEPVDAGIELKYRPSTRFLIMIPDAEPVPISQLPERYLAQAKLLIAA